MTVRVTLGKGKKDRLTILSHNVLKVLRKYFVAHSQKLLGHHHIKITLIYTHIANDSLLASNSPLDL